MLIPTFNALANTDSKIIIDMEYIVITPTENGDTQISDMVSFKNESTEEYKGDGNTDGVISVLLPPDAKGFKVQDENIDYKQTETGFVTTKPIPANESITVPYTYTLDAGKEILLSFNYPIAMYQILIPEGFGSIEVKDAKAENQGLMQFEDKNYWVYLVQNIQANQNITMTYNKDKQPEGGTATDTETQQKDADNENLGNVTKTAPDFHNPGHLRMWAQSPLRKFDPHILMIVLGAIIIAGIGYFSYFKWKNNAKAKATGLDKDELVFKQLMAKQKAILDRILELEGNFESGKVTEDEYKTKLEAYKHHLVQVKLSLRDFVE